MALELRNAGDSVLAMVGIRGDALAAGTYSLGQSITGIFSGGGGASGIIYLEPADFTGGLSRLRMRLVIATNATAPVATFTLNLYPVTAGGGAAAQVILTPGTIVPGSPAVVTLPGATALNTGDSGDFTTPAAGFYAFGLVVSATMAVNSAVYVRGQLIGKR